LALLLQLEALPFRGRSGSQHEYATENVTP
jgi:hypothetical protein